MPKPIVGRNGSGACTFHPIDFAGKMAENLFQPVMVLLYSGSFRIRNLFYIG